LGHGSTPWILPQHAPPPATGGALERHPPGFFALFSLLSLDTNVLGDSNFMITALINTAKTGKLADGQKDICM
jgi:hypothetical protein